MRSSQIRLTVYLLSSRGFNNTVFDPFAFPFAQGRLLQVDLIGL